MKFEDKLVELRKKSGLSQEQLAEKLDVTRQTISKWELGQSKPDMDKLTAMSKLYNINIDELIDESKKEITLKEKKTDYSKRKPILYIVIILFIFCIGFLGYRIFNNNDKNDNKNEKNSIFDIFNNMNISNEFSITKFNNEFENDSGEQSAFFTKEILSDLITSNSKNKDHLIELIVDNENYGTDVTRIKEYKQSLNDNDKYDVSFEYDENGYINKMIIDTIEEDLSVNSFNNQFEIFSGESTGFLLESRMADLITSNKKYSKHQIELIFDGVSYGTDTEKITEKKYSLKSSNKYDLSFEYDEKGFINKFIIVSR